MGTCGTLPRREQWQKQGTPRYCGAGAQPLQNSTTAVQGRGSRRSPTLHRHCVATDSAVLQPLLLCCNGLCCVATGCLCVRACVRARTRTRACVRECGERAGREQGEATPSSSHLRARMRPECRSGGAVPSPSPHKASATLFATAPMRGIPALRRARRRLATARTLAAEECARWVWS